MKMVKKTSKSLIIGIAMTGLTMNFNACSNDSPAGPAGLSSSNQGKLHFINLSMDDNALAKKRRKTTNNDPESPSSSGNSNDTQSSSGTVIMETTEFVTYKDGGELIIDYKGYEHGAGDEEIKTTFKVFSETISEDARLVLSMTDALLCGEVDVTFQPHGITFSSPALLNIEAKNIDLSGVDPNAIGIYYVNDETGEWEAMQTYDIIVKKKEGYLKIMDAEIPHFSRYAVAWSN